MLFPNQGARACALALAFAAACSSSNDAPTPDDAPDAGSSIPPDAADGSSDTPDAAVPEGDGSVSPPSPDAGEAADGGLPDDALVPGRVAVRRTTHGVLHVRAADYFGAGYGVAYGFAQDNRCLLARRLAEVNGRLSELLGADAEVRSEVHDLTYTALQSDHYYRGWFDIAAIRAGFEAGAPEVRALAAGYAAGINRLRADRPDHDPCDLDLPTEVTVDDVYRMWVATAAVASGEMLESFLPTSAPGERSATPPPVAPKILSSKFGATGSNAWALGRDATQTGGSVHLYNPHFPWAGIQRLYMVHVTIPGELDVMGSALGGFPLPLAGFTQHVAWGLTFSTTARWTARALRVGLDGMSYSVDGKPKQIHREVLAIPVRGESTPRQVPFFRADEGPILDAPDFFLGWGGGTAYAVRDVNADNTRIMEQFLRIAQAKSVAEVKEQLSAVQGVPWSYTVASDSHGDVFFGDVSNVPGLSSADITSCLDPLVGQLLRSSGFFVLDGSRSACNWTSRLAPSLQPQVTRSDYVANSNNNFALPHPSARLRGFSPIFGDEAAPLSLRAGLGLHMIADRLAGTDGLGAPKFTGALARDVLYHERNRAAELLVDGIVADCRANPSATYDGASVDLAPVCNVLAHWDKRNTTTSRGAAVFRGLWMQITATARSQLFATPASLDAPLTTPTGYTDNPLVRASVRNALARIAVTFPAHGIALDAAWGDVNSVKTPGGSHGVPGGFESEGCFDAIVSSDGYYTYDGWLASTAGNTPSHLFGTSYMHAVELGADGPKATGLMPYSQATEPSSAYYLDQVAAWSKAEWFAFPFTEAAIASDPALTTLVLEH